MDGKHISERASALAKQTAEAGDRAVAAVNDTAHKAGDKASDIGESLYQKGAQAAHTLGQTVEEHPVATLLIAAAVGFGLTRLSHRH
jgi:ElaB/YqjD/DUF883 family membrane-anchored ribosome-binding protein